MMAMIVMVVAMASSILFAAPSREETVNKWLTYGDKLAGNSERAKIVVAYLKDAGIFAPQSGKGLDVLVEKAGNSNLGIVALTSKDDKVSPQWREVYDSSYTTRFHKGPEGSFVIVLDKKFSDMWTSVNLLHGGSLAYSDATGEFSEIKDPVVRGAKCLLAAYNTQIEVIEKMGGNAYQELLKRMVLRVADDGNLFRPNIRFWQHDLEDTFGKAASLNEINARLQLVWVHGVFEFIEQYTKNPADIEGKKLQFIKSFLI